MGNKVLMTEGELKSLIYESVKNIINEVGTVPPTQGSNAFQTGSNISSFINNGNQAAFKELAKTNTSSGMSRSAMQQAAIAKQNANAANTNANGVNSNKGTNVAGKGVNVPKAPAFKHAPLVNKMNGLQSKKALFNMVNRGGSVNTRMAEMFFRNQGNQPTSQICGVINIPFDINMPGIPGPQWKTIMDNIMKMGGNPQTDVLKPTSVQQAGQHTWLIFKPTAAKGGYSMK